MVYVAALVRRLARGYRLLLLLALLGPLVTALVLLSGAIENTGYSGRLYTWLIAYLRCG